MKLLVVFAFAVAAVSAGTVPIQPIAFNPVAVKPIGAPIQPRSNVESALKELEHDLVEKVHEIEEKVHEGELHFLNDIREGEEKLVHNIQEREDKFLDSVREHVRELLPKSWIHPKDLPAAAKPEGRITNGQKASPGQFPYQVGLSFASSGGSWWCGGSLIAEQWVLTAAHCTSGATAATAYLGATVRTSPQATYTVQSSNFVQHASYNSILLRNDIALIKIPAVSFSSLINKIALPAISSSYSTYVGVTAVASGWGLTSDSATSVASDLNYVDLQIIANSVCANTYGTLVVTDRNICAATPQGKSTCNGDSGGPLVHNGEQIGVVSFGSSAGCQLEYPAGFTRVTYYLDWIQANTK